MTTLGQYTIAKLADAEWMPRLMGQPMLEEPAYTLAVAMLVCLQHYQDNADDPPVFEDFEQMLAWYREVLYELSQAAIEVTDESTPSAPQAPKGGTR